MYEVLLRIPLCCHMDSGARKQDIVRASEPIKGLEQEKRHVNISNKSFLLMQI